MTESLDCMVVVPRCGFFKHTASNERFGPISRMKWSIASLKTPEKVSSRLPVRTMASTCSSASDRAARAHTFMFHFDSRGLFGAMMEYSRRSGHSNQPPLARVLGNRRWLSVPGVYRAALGSGEA